MHWQENPSLFINTMWIMTFPYKPFVLEVENKGNDCQNSTIHFRHCNLASEGRERRLYAWSFKMIVILSFKVRSWQGKAPTFSIIFIYKKVLSSCQSPVKMLDNWLKCAFFSRKRWEIIQKTWETTILSSDKGHYHQVKVMMAATSIWKKPHILWGHMLKGGRALIK